MSTTRLISPYSLTILQTKPCSKSKKFILKQADRSFFFANGRELRYLSSGRRSPTGRYRNTMDLILCSKVEPGAPLPSDPPPNFWKGWILGTLITIILPFLTNKWGPLFKLSKDVEVAAERADQLVEVIEKVAEDVEKLADNVADDLPEGGKLRDAIESIENVAEKTAKAAQLVDDLIDKVTEVDEKVESYMEPVGDEANETAKEATDQKQKEE